MEARQKHIVVIARFCQTMSEAQQLIVDLSLKVTTEKISAISLANGVRNIIMKKWPKCKVTLDDIAVNWIADANMSDVEDEDENAKKEH